MRILVADDDPVHRTVLGRMIERMGHAVEAVEDGAEAVAAAAVQDYETVILDIYMPNMDGLSAARSIRRAQGSKRGPYLIALTAGTDPDLQARCDEAGFDAFLAKPVRLDTLRDVVSAIPSPGGDAVARPHAIAVHGVVEDPGSLDDPTLDMDVLRRFRAMMGADDEDFIRELEADFVQDAGALAHAIARAGESGDPVAMARAAHALKSNCMMLGAMRLSTLAHALERLADAGLPQPWMPLHARIVAEIDEVATSLSASAPFGS